MKTTACRLPALLLLACLCTSCSLLPFGDGRQYTVRKGDSLYSIAFRYKLDYREIAHLNGIKPPYIIYPRQQLRLPPRQFLGFSLARADPPGETVVWRWPVEGRLLSRFEPEADGAERKSGISIAAEAGTQVVAAAAGKVVYASSKVQGYGHLVIVKHNDTYLSAYGHNRRILVREGREVRAGDRLAEVGSDNSGEPALYFEIRRNGRPRDPLEYLPSRDS